MRQLQHTMKGQIVSFFNKQISHKSPGMYSKHHNIKKNLKRIENHNWRCCLFKTSERTKTAVKLTNTGPDKNYGNLLHDPFLDLTESQIEEYKHEFLDKLSSESQIKMLEMRTIRQNQCEEWYIKRKNG